MFNGFVVLLYCFRFVGIDYYWSVYCQNILVIVGLYHYCRGIVVFLLVHGRCYYSAGVLCFSVLCESGCLFNCNTGLTLFVI